MNRTELIELAEKHGYGAEAAKILAGMSARMIGVLVAHAAVIDNANGEGMCIAATRPTRQALLGRELTARATGGHTVHNPPYTITEMGYRVIGLFGLVLRQLMA